MSGYESSRSESKDRGRRNSSTHRHRGDDYYASKHSGRLQSLPIRSRRQDGRLHDARHSTTSSSSTKSYGPSPSRTARYGLASGQSLGATENQGHATTGSLPVRTHRASIGSTEIRPTVTRTPSVTSSRSRESSGNGSLMFHMSQDGDNGSRAHLSSRRDLENESRGRSRPQDEPTARRDSSIAGPSNSSWPRQPTVSEAFRTAPLTGSLWGGGSSSSSGAASSSRASVSSRMTNVAAGSASASFNDCELSVYTRPPPRELSSGLNASFHGRRSSAASNSSSLFAGKAIDIPSTSHSVKPAKHDPQLFPGTGWTPEYENGLWNSWTEGSTLRAQRDEYKKKDNDATKRATRYKEKFTAASSVSSSAGLGKSVSTDVSADSLEGDGLTFLPIPKKNLNAEQHLKYGERASRASNALVDVANQRYADVEDKDKLYLKRSLLTERDSLWGHKERPRQLDEKAGRYAHRAEGHFERASRLGAEVPPQNMDKARLYLEQKRKERRERHKTPQPGPDADAEAWANRMRQEGRLTKEHTQKWKRGSESWY